MNNEDSASISFRKFNSSPKDKYPEITFCIVERHGQIPIFSEKRLRNYKYNVSDYWDTITGKLNSTTEDIKKLPEFSNVTVPLEHWILGKIDPNLTEYDTVDIAEILESRDFSLSNVSNKDFHLSHQDSNQICYSITSEFKQNQPKVIEYITLGLARPNGRTRPSRPDGLARPSRPAGISNLSNGILRVYAHFKGQTVRNLGKELFRIQIKLLRQQLISIHLSSFTVLRRRVDAKITCNPNLEGYDDMFRRYVNEKIECVPPYWKIFYQNSTDLKSCDTQKQLVEASSYNEDKKHYKVFAKLNPPCSEMTATSTVETKDHSSGVFIRFFYREDQYLEITNLPDFEVNSLWSSIGGFVGIFLGISVYHIAEHVLEIINKIIAK